MAGKMLSGKIPDRIREDFRFIRGWIRRPGKVGSITPTGRETASHMAGLIPLETGLPVLELGPGTGVITREILNRGLPPEQLVSIEYSQDFYRHLVRNFPGVNFIHGDVLDMDTVLSGYSEQKFAGVIGAIPLLNLSMEKRIEIVGNYLDRVAGDGPFVQICYGTKPPVAAVPGRFTVKKSRRIYRNVPPATVWIYRKDRSRASASH